MAAFGITTLWVLYVMQIMLRLLLPLPLLFTMTTVHTLHVLIDTISIKKDLCQKPNCMLQTFSCRHPLTKTKLKLCLSLYGSALWLTFSSELQFLETTFNNALHKIWSLPHRCNTAILHLVAGLPSLYISRSNKLALAAEKSQCRLLMDIFRECHNLVYTGCEYNLWYGPPHSKSYSHQEFLCASSIRDVRFAPEMNP